MGFELITDHFDCFDTSECDEYFRDSIKEGFSLIFKFLMLLGVSLVILVLDVGIIWLDAELMRVNDLALAHHVLDLLALFGQ